MIRGNDIHVEAQMNLVQSKLNVSNVLCSNMWHEKSYLLPSCHNTPWYGRIWYSPIGSEWNVMNSLTIQTTHTGMMLTTKVAISVFKPPSYVMTSQNMHILSHIKQSVINYELYSKLWVGATWQIQKLAILSVPSQKIQDIIFINMISLTSGYQKWS